MYNSTKCHCLLDTGQQCGNPKPLDDDLCYLHQPGGKYPCRQFVKQQQSAIVVFDFECTLTYSHWHYFAHIFDVFRMNPQWMKDYDGRLVSELHQSVHGLFTADDNDLSKLSNTQRQLLIDLIFGGHVRLQMIHTFLKQLQTMGCQLHLTSDGYCQEIIGLLRLTHLEQFFVSNGDVRINAYDSFCQEMTKDHYLHLLAQKLPAGGLFYIDDDYSRHQELITMIPEIIDNYVYLGVNPLKLYPEQNGLTESMFNIIIDTIRNRTITPIKSQNPYQVVSISGPSLFAFYPDILGKRILLLGDRHVIDSLCSRRETYDVHEWLYDLSSQTHECLDILVEMPYLKQQTQIQTKLHDHPHGRLWIYHSPIDAVRHKFLSCYTRIKTEPCVSDHLRFHYMDTRVIDNIVVIEAIMTTINLPPHLVSRYGSQQSNIYRYILGLNRDTDIRNIYYHILQELSGINGIALDVSALDRFTLTYWNLIGKEMNKLNMNLSEKQRFIETLLKTGDTLGPLVWLGVGRIYIESYYLTRMFIKFKTNSDRSNGCHSENIMRNIIVYAGGGHCKFIITFIELWLGKHPISEFYRDFFDHDGDATSQCIQFSKPFDYFMGTTSHT